MNHIDLLLHMTPYILCHIAVHSRCTFFIGPLEVVTADQILYAALDERHFWLEPSC